jgi:hypothetical protein
MLVTIQAAGWTSLTQTAIERWRRRRRKGVVDLREPVEQRTARSA